MVLTSDIRFKRMKQEYLGLHEAQDSLMDKVDSFEVALLDIAQVVQENRELILENRKMIQENRVAIQENKEAIQANRELILENRAMLSAIVKHLEVPYQKPPMGFRPE